MKNPEKAVDECLDLIALRDQEIEEKEKVIVKQAKEIEALDKLVACFHNTMVEIRTGQPEKELQACLNCGHSEAGK